MTHAFLRTGLAALVAGLILTSCGGGGGDANISPGPGTPVTPSGPPPRLIVEPLDETRVEGDRVGFSTIAEGDNVRYQWLRNGVAINGALASATTVQEVFAADNASVWTVEASNAVGKIRAQATLKVVPNTPSVLLAGQAARHTSDARSLLQNALVGLALDGAGGYLLADPYKLNRLSVNDSVSTFIRPRPASAVTIDCDSAAVARGQAGTVYWIDPCLHTIWKISPTGAITAFAGGRAGFTDGQGAAAQFDRPTSAVIDSHGNLFVADTSNSRIRRVTPSGQVSTFAGGNSGILNSYGTAAGHADGLGLAAAFTFPTALAIDPQDNLYLADATVIRKITPAGAVSTLAGSPEYSGNNDGSAATARFMRPGGLAVTNDGVLFVADLGNRLIRKVSPDGVVTTLAGDPSGQGSRDGSGSAATFGAPRAIVLDTDGSLLVGDSGYGVRRVSTSGAVSTVLRVGAVLDGTIKDGVGTSARFNRPGAMAFDRQGVLHVADFYPASADGVLRSIDSSAAVSSSAPLNASAIAFDAQGNLYSSLPNDQPGAIQKTTPSGAVSTFYTMKQAILETYSRGVVSHLVTDSDGSVYAAETGIWLGPTKPQSGTPCGNSVVVRFSPAGVRTVLAGAKPDAQIISGRPETPFCEISGMARDKAGNLWVADARRQTISKISPDGSVVVVAGKELSLSFANFGANPNPDAVQFNDGTGINARLKRPGAMAFAPSGELLFIDDGKVRVLSPSGTVRTIARSTGGMGTISGIAVDAGGTVLLAIGTAIYTMTVPN